METILIREAREHLHILCEDPSKFRMRIPVQEDDSDQIFSHALDYATEMESKVTDLEEKLAKLKDKSENVLAEFNECGGFSKASAELAKELEE